MRVVRVWRKIFKILLNLEKQQALLNQVQTIPCSESEVTNQDKINQELKYFSKNIFTEKSEFQKEDINAYLGQINISLPTEEQSQT